MCAHQQLPEHSNSGRGHWQEQGEAGTDLDQHPLHQATLEQHIQPSPAGVPFAYIGDKVGSGNSSTQDGKPLLVSSSEQVIFSTM